MRFVYIGQVHLNCDCIVSITSYTKPGPPIQFQIKVVDCLGNTHVNSYETLDELTKKLAELLQYLKCKPSA